MAASAPRTSNSLPCGVEAGGVIDAEATTIGHIEALGVTTDFADRAAAANRSSAPKSQGARPTASVTRMLSTRILARRPAGERPMPMRTLSGSDSVVSQSTLPRSRSAPAVLTYSTAVVSRVPMRNR